MSQSDSEAAETLSKLLGSAEGARLILAGLSVLPPGDSSRYFSVGKPKSTSGHFLAGYEVWQCACADQEKWGGICFDSPILEFYKDGEQWVVGHKVIYVAGSEGTLPREFRERFDSLADAVEFILRFFFRDSQLYLRLTALL